jgi:methionyl-tRNA formyltransferase
MENKRIIFMGTPSFAIPTLDLLIANKYNIVGIVSQPDKQIGRKKEIIYSPVKNFAIKNNIEIIQPVKI